MIERRIGRRGQGVHPRLAIQKERAVVERERPEIEEKTLTRLFGTRPTMALTKGIDLCRLFMDKETFECSESCPKYQECGCPEGF